MRKVCVVTGTRAEYGLLSRLMWLIRADHDLTLQIIATNMHLSPEFGLTYKEIEADGFTIDKKVEMLLSSDTSNAITKSIGLATIGFADAYEDLQPDILLMDEPFSALDAITREEMQAVFLELWQTYHVTTLLVTHQAEEAVLLGQKIAVLSARPAHVLKALDNPLFGNPAARREESFIRLENELRQLLGKAKEPL